MNVIATAVITFIVPMFVFLVYMGSLVFTIVKYQPYCLDMGYPKVNVTWNYDVYCTGYEGVVNPDVIKVEK